MRTEKEPNQSYNDQNKHHRGNQKLAGWLNCRPDTAEGSISELEDRFEEIA